MSVEAPFTRSDMLRLPPEERQAFLDAEDRELKSIEDMEVEEREVPIPPGVKPLTSIFTYKYKEPVTQPPDPVTGIVPTQILAKARWAGREFKTMPMTEFFETFAPTGKNVTFRLFMLITLALSYVTLQLDVNTAFLYASLSKPVYMYPPPGRPCKPGHCLKIVKALYGLRAAPREWNHLLESFITGLGFVVSSLDSCLFYKWVDGSIILILIYVDDILMTAKDQSYLDNLKDLFMKRFQCK